MQSRPEKFEISTCWNIGSGVPRLRACGSGRLQPHRSESTSRLVASPLLGSQGTMQAVYHGACADVY